MSDLKAEIQAALAEAGVGSSAAATSTDQPSAPSPAEVDYEKLAGLVAAKLKPADAPPAAGDVVADALRALAGASGGEKYRSPGAPSPAPRELYDRDATRWSRDYIERMQADGTFKAELEKYRSTLPGGSGGLFRKRIPSAR